MILHADGGSMAVALTVATLGSFVRRVDGLDLPLA